MHAINRRLHQVKVAVVRRNRVIRKVGLSKDTRSILLAFQGTTGFLCDNCASRQQKKTNQGA